MIKVGSVVKLKKNHACGDNAFEVIKLGIDLKLKCLKCGHIIELSRIKFNKELRGELNEKEKEKI